MSNVFLIPGTIISGNEASEKSGFYLKESGNKALIVTDKMMVHWKCSKINQPLVVERQQYGPFIILKNSFLEIDSYYINAKEEPYMMSITLAIYIFIVQFMSFIIKGLVGFGNPLLSNPLMAMQLDNKVITPANLLLDTPINAWIVWKNRKAFSIKKTMPVVILIMLGVIPGTLFLKMGSPWIIKVFLGVFIIGLGIEMAIRDRSKTIKSNRVLKIIISISSGFMAGLFGINMLFLTYFERTAIDRNEFRSNVCFVFLFENVFRFFVYAATGVFQPIVFQIFAISIPAAVLGVLVGSKIDKKIDEKVVNQLVITTFILGGFSIFVKALIFKE
ncbi:MAG: hypothetical protein H6Q69_2084 [Firmicutes bacterium]|nr:hypothetical protein [Bacillota bacterium]